MTDDRLDTIPAPPPDDCASDWPGLDADTASEAPRSLTPVPGSKPKKRSGEWELLHDRVGEDPSGVRVAKTVRTLDANVDSVILRPLPGYPPKMPPGAGRDR